MVLTMDKEMNDIHEIIFGVHMEDKTMEGVFKREPTEVANEEKWDESEQGISRDNVIPS